MELMRPATVSRKQSILCYLAERDGWAFSAALISK
jgi:hypothetical protein